ncbi:hypothetical protein HWC53_gp088 [Bacillus phage vB_BmeM-Goe8]|uniref:Uncharacterized protein n=1 Tax=Bacillus phage vB_BmeM-Goe8 TaxID=2593638 RepID=A0A516KN27_9CAUD|nr:hypothetical protein HWC53_gp088 [Bacillus phage vB_BmeM-Goe8]QDP43001.1 hypothetical protein Goe8_c02280 [Bacillus phage vB_BmeM-Goe8]
MKCSFYKCTQPALHVGLFPEITDGKEEIIKALACEYHVKHPAFKKLNEPIPIEDKTPHTNDFLCACAECRKEKGQIIRKPAITKSKPLLVPDLDHLLSVEYTCYRLEKRYWEGAYYYSYEYDQTM